MFVCQNSVERKKPFVLIKSEPGRLVFACSKESCEFKMVFHGNHEGVFVLIENKDRTCLAALPTFKRVWIRHVADILRLNQKVTAKILKEYIKNEYEVEVDATLVKNALSDDKKKPKDNQAFGFVSSFLDAFTRLNEGTTTSLLSKEGVFQRAFLCPGMCARAFEHTTKIVGLDACHIKASYGGVLLVVTALDGNGQIFPVAVGIAESENTTTWSWFLWLVQSALHIFNGGDGIVFLSDREKGIENSLREVFPRAAHGFCAFHIQKNVKKHFQTSIEGLLFQAAKAATVKEFDEKMTQMRAMHPDAAAYIELIDKAKWARAFFPVRRLGHITSNIAESMNKWLGEARYQDPVGLFSTFITGLNRVFEKRRDRYASLPQAALPKRVAQMLEASGNESRKLDVRRHTRTLFEVQAEEGKGGWKTVDLQELTCTCGFFREFEVPCRHMCASLLSIGDDDLPRLVAPERRREALVSTYVGFIVPVDVSLLPNDGMQPPEATKKRGRRKEKRIPSCVENQPKKTVTCSRCHARGHNARSCKK